MPLRKPDDTYEDGDVTVLTATKPFPPEAYEYEAELSPEKIKLIQAKADKILSEEEWVIVDGVGKR
jgi:hypothetical protein